MHQSSNHHSASNTADMAGGRRGSTALMMNDRRNSSASYDTAATAQSTDSNTSSTELKIVYRAKHQPHHRCQSVNGSLTSIVKQSSRYSKNDGYASSTSSANSDASTDLPKHPTTQSRVSIRKFFRSLKPSEIKKLKNLIVVFTTIENDNVDDDADGADDSLDNIDTSFSSSTSSVDFSDSMDVHVFDE